jgi:glycosyltransferase involved in cell wall biosynthesis
VLYTGNAGVAHEFETVLDAAGQLREAPITFLFIGGGAARGWIQQEANRRGLANILLHDYVPTKQEIRSIMACAGCALITLKDWSAGVVSPSKLHANLAMGLPIAYVGPANSNVGECIRHFNCGLHCRPGQIRELAEFILLLSQDAICRDYYALRARAAFDDAYCDRKTLPQFDLVFDGLAARVPGGRRALRSAIPTSVYPS